MDFSKISSCTDLRGEHIAAAARSSDVMRALLARFQEIAAPGKGAPVILAALSRLGTTACTWIDGELRIELVGHARNARDEARTMISISTTIGGGFREKLFPDVVLTVPLEEFSRAIALTPRLIEPLSMKETAKRLVLSASAEVRKTSVPPPMIEIDPSCLEIVPKLAAPVRLTTPDLFELDPPSTAAKATLVGIPAPANKPEEPKVVLRRRVRKAGEGPGEKT